MSRSLLFALSTLLISALYAGPNEAEMWQQFQSDKAMEGLNEEFEKPKPKPAAKKPEPAEKKSTPEPAQQRIAMPDHVIQVALVKQSIQSFALSVNAKDMTGFYNDSGNHFRNNFTIEKLNKVFEQFMLQNIDLTAVKDMTPIFDQKTKMHPEKDLIVMVGHYETSPSLVNFEVYYLMENGAWKLVAINIEVK